jgi:RNA-directed DNA polymerase
MKESYGEGVASHTGPELCADAREGMGEALAGARAGRVLSRESLVQIGVPTPSMRPEGNTTRAAIARLAADPARSKTSRTPGNSPRRNWETPGPALAKGAKVRAVNPIGARRR